MNRSLVLGMAAGGAVSILLGMVFAVLTLAQAGSFDTTPPSIVIEPPRGAVSGQLTLEIDVIEEQPGLETFTVQLDNGAAHPLPFETPALYVLDTTTLADGPHVLIFRASDQALRANEAEVVLPIDVDNRAPRIQVAEESQRAHQGKTFPVVVKLDELATGRLTFLDQHVPLYPIGNSLMRALVGVPIQAEPGTEKLTIWVQDAAGNTSRRDVDVQLRRTEFERGGLIRLSAAQRAARKDEEGKAQMREERDAAYAHEELKQLWDGAMGFPARGRKTSPFGKYRRYSDGQRSHHTGLDIANRRGSPVWAANSGVVVLAKEQAIFGNVVIVHHGQGVSTSYNHLNRIDVTEGQKVEKGHQVGLLGSTGQSTGPHLHWGLVVHGVAVDPAEWVERGFEASEFTSFR